MNRVMKFALVGALCGGLQIVLLTFIVEWLSIDSHFGKNVINAVTFFSSVQVNFALSCAFTWKDRMSQDQTLWRRILSFNSMMIASWIANQLVFALAVIYLPVAVSGILGLVAGGIINYFVSNKIVFASQKHAWTRA